MNVRLRDSFREIIYAQSGISLSDKKEALLCGRINKRLRALGLADYEAYLAFLEHDSSGDEMVQLIDAISTNVTHFFRENSHFNFMRKVIPEWLADGKRSLRIWSAACSTGEEPYSIAMVMEEILAGRMFDLKILATDISTRVLNLCQQGVYDDTRFREMPDTVRRKWFKEVAGTAGRTNYKIDDRLKKHIRFHRINLSQVPYAMKGPFDIIFCRNVMIYFDADVKNKLLGEIKRLLAPGGYLLVGHAESLAALDSKMTLVQPSIYKK